MLIVKTNRSSRPEMFCEKGVLKICSKFTGEHPCRSAISIKLLCNFIEIALWHGCSPVNLPHIFRILFPRNSSGGLLLFVDWWWLKWPKGFWQSEKLSWFTPHEWLQVNILVVKSCKKGEKRKKVWLWGPYLVSYKKCCVNGWFDFLVLGGNMWKRQYASILKSL